MNPLPQALESHLAQDVTSHCFCWIIRRDDGQVHGFTDHDRSLSVAGAVCEPQTGMSASEATSQLGLAVDTAEVEGALSSLAITESDIERGAFDGATVETWLVNWQEPDQAIRLRKALVGKITRNGGRFVAELKSSAALLDAVKGRRVARACDAQPGEARCGIAANDPRFSATGTVAVVGRSDVVVNGLDGFAAQWFQNGVLTWIDGANAGRRASIASHANNRLVLTSPPALPVETGDRFSIIAGCDRSFACCKSKFGNSVNFRGFPHLPGNDAAYEYADGKSVFDGGPLVP